MAGASGAMHPLRKDFKKCNGLVNRRLQILSVLNQNF